jgi:hypothetical protein
MPRNVTRAPRKRKEKRNHVQDNLKIVLSSVRLPRAQTVRKFKLSKSAGFLGLSLLEVLRSLLCVPTQRRGREINACGGVVGRNEHGTRGPARRHRPLDEVLWESSSPITASSPTMLI